MQEDRSITFKDPETIRWPYEAYAHLRDEAPVYFDPELGIFVISRYEDIRRALRDSTAFDSEHATEKLRGTVDPERSERIKQLFLAEGWPRERPIGNYEGEEYRELRRFFEQFLRAGKVKEYDGMIRDIAYSLVASFAADGRCELVSQYAEQISMRVICGVLGVSDHALPVVKDSMDAMVANLGFVQNEDEEIANARKEIAAQHYFMAMIERLRRDPDGTMLSAFVNTRLPSGRIMTDPQILMHVMLDLFMAGAETSSKAITSGVVLLCRDMGTYRRLETDPDGNLRAFVEEVLRLEGPASGLFRVALKDVTLHGVTIPIGSVVMLRVAAANRDERQFSCPAAIDLARSNSATHLSFGSGAHSCLGAPVARRELYWAFKALLDSVTDLQLEPGEDPRYTPSLIFRGIPDLRVTFSERR